MPAVLYYCQDEKKVLNGEVIDYLKDISKKIADQKNLMIEFTWHNFFNQVSLDISEH